MWYLRRARWWLQNRWYRLKSTLKRWWSRLGAGAALYKLLGATKLLGLAKFGKMAFMMINMLVFAWAMALLHGWPFGLGLLGILFLHEMGHVVAGRLLGVPTSLPLFIPFLGALITLKRMPKHAVEEAIIGAGGPVGGLIATLLCLGLYRWTGNTLWMALTISSAFMHLFNLVPVAPLDGGRIVGAISRWIWYPLLPLLLFLGLYEGNFLLLLIVWFGLSELRRTYGPLAREYFRAAWWQRLLVAVAYFGLLAINAWIFRTGLSWEAAQGYGAPDLSEGSMAPWLAAGITALLTVTYAVWRVYRSRKEQALAQAQAHVRAQEAQVDPHKAWLRSLRVYRRLSAGHGRRWRVAYRGRRSGWKR